MNLPVRGQFYVAVVAALGLIAIGICIANLWESPVSSEWIFLALLTLLTGSFTVAIPGLPARISVSETFVFTSVLLFGTSAGTLTVALDTVVATLAARRKARQAPLKILFNLAAAALSIWIAGSAFYAISGLTPLSQASAPLPAVLGPLVAMTAIYFVLNSALVAGALSFEKAQPAFQIWRKNFLWLSVNYFGGASVAALLVAYTKTVDLTAFSIIVPLVVISYLTYKTSLGRVEDANRHVDEMKRLHVSTIETLATAIDAKDQVTHGHIRRVQQHTLGLARAIGITDPSQLNAIEAAALLHDLGKLVVPEHILNKPGRLTPGEFERMKLHAGVGADILSSIRFPYPVVPIVRHHHENWDGTGYPDGLRGTQIPLGARILSVVDCFDALTSDRPYRSKLADDEAVAILMARRGSMYDPLVVDTFVQVKEELAKAYLQSVDAIDARISSTTELPTGHGHLPPQLTSDAALAFRTVLESVSAKINVSLAMVFLREPVRDEVFVADIVGQDSHKVGRHRLPVGSRVTGWVVANGQRIVNADSYLEFDGAFKDGRVYTAVPIKSDGQVIGTLSLVSTPGYVFSEADLNFVERAARSLDEFPTQRLFASNAQTSRRPSPSTRPTVH